MEDKYKSFSAAQMAGEESFIQWVKHGENDMLWTQWLKTFPEHTETMNEARHIVQTLSAREAPTMNADVKQQLWSSIKADISRKKRNFKTRNFILRWSVAAAAVIGILLWYNVSADIQNIVVNPGVTADVTLPESSVVTVNAGSKIRYNERHFFEERQIRMEGEAFFKVTPGSTFTIITPQGNVTVVGTSFNVIARPGRFEVSCFTGKVRVEQSPKDKVEITSGQRCYASGMKEKLQLKTFDPSASTPDWTRGKFTFENQPLSMVVSELERQYDVSVKLSPEIKDLKYTGLFESGDLEEAVKLITWWAHLHAQISGNTVTISR